MERLDHVLIRVDDLEESVNQFRLAGFRVYYGAQREKAYNAMIYFEDDSFIELVDTTKFPFILNCLATSRITNLLGAFYKRIGAYARSKDRYLDYSVYSKNIEVDHERVSNKASKLYSLKRVDTLGTVLKWKLFAFSTLELPFVMSDYAPYKYPEEGATNHNNRVLGMNRLLINTTTDLAKLKESIIHLFNTAPDCIQLTERYLEIKTNNAIIQYATANVNAIVGVELKNLGPKEFSFIEAYGIMHHH